MKRTLLLSFIFFSTLTNSYGQKDWTTKFNGYVLKKDSTIESGYLKFNGTSQHQGIRIELYKKPNQSPQIFYAFDLLGYSYEKDTIKILEQFKLFGNKKKQFDYIEAKIETSGVLTLYALQIESEGYRGNSGGFGSNGFNSVYVINPEKIYVIESKDQMMTVVTKKNFKEVMIALLSEDHSLVSSIETNRLKFKNIKSIIKEYNRKTR